MAISGDFFLPKVAEMRVVKVESDDGVLDEFSGGGQGGGVLWGRE